MEKRGRGDLTPEEEKAEIGERQTQAKGRQKLEKGRDIFTPHVPSLTNPLISAQGN